MAIYILSDLHLCADRPLADQAFARFLREHAMRAHAIYLLGDLVEYWVGDDTLDVERPAFVDRLRVVTDSGVPVFYMYGNRDFLMGQRFARESGCTWIDDPTVIDLYGTQTLLMHGDTLCIDDVAYQAFRRQVRDPAWQSAFLARSFADRSMLAKNARSKSAEHARAQPEYIMDVNQGAVETALRRAGVSRLIHGHTHRPGMHRFTLDGRAAERIVLGDWYTSATVLRVDADRIESIDINP